MAVSNVSVRDEWDIEAGYAELSVRITLDSLDVDPLRDRIETVISEFIEGSR